MNPGAIHFLAENNMNLDLWTKEGIPFCTGDDAIQLLDKFYKNQKQKQQEESDIASGRTPSSPYASRRRVQLTERNDKDFHAKAMARLREWLDSAIVPRRGGDNNDDITLSEGTFFDLPPCNGFLRRALYETIPSEYPNLVLETVEGQIRVWRMNAMERQRRNQRLLQEGWQKLIEEKIGAWRVFLALSKACRGELFPTTQAEHMALALNVEQAMTSFLPSPSSSPRQGRKIPLVVHNGLQDLLFLFTHFNAPKLPETWKGCKELIHSHFPVVYDTKLMAIEYCPRDTNAGRQYTHLAAVYQQAISRYPHFNNSGSEAASDGAEAAPAGGQDQGDNDTQEHDAAYDAYMTGVAFCGLSYTIHEQQRMGRHTHLLPSVGDASRHHNLPWNSNVVEDDVASNVYGKNKLNFHLSPYTIDLETGSDPMRRGMSRESTFRISNIDPSVNTRDILQCVKGLLDSNERQVQFELIWVDDTTFLVGAMVRSGRKDVIQEHGNIIFQAVAERFETVECLKGLVKATSSDRKKRESSGFWNLWGLFGKKNFDNDEDSRPNKRRRVE